jgi:hypothetical protein
VRQPRSHRPPDPLARALAAHALADDQRREAQHLLARLDARIRAAEAAAADRWSRAREALDRGDESRGLSLADASADASRDAARHRERLGAARDDARRLASVERRWRAELFLAIDRFLRGEGA